MFFLTILLISNFFYPTQFSCLTLICFSLIPIVYMYVPFTLLVKFFCLYYLN